MKTLWTAVLSLTVAVLCWFLAEFISYNLIIGLFVNYGESSEASRVGFSSVGGITQLVLWVIMLLGIKKVVASQRKAK